MSRPSIVDFKHPDVSVYQKSLSTPAKELRQNRAASKEACGNCYRLGEKLSRCAKCKTVAYCSKECQRSHWPVHKTGCTPVDGSTLSLVKITQRLLAGRTLYNCVEQACVYACDMFNSPVPPAERYQHKPFVVRIDVAIEPEDVKAFYKLYNNDHGDSLSSAKTPQSNIPGLVQINAITDWSHTGIVPEGGMQMWRNAKASLVGTHLHDACQGLVCVSKGNTMLVFHPIVVAADTVVDLKPGGARSTFGVRSAITGGHGVVPRTLENVIEFMNTHIREDKKNKLCLRSVLGDVDIQTIKDAGAAARVLKESAGEEDDEQVDALNEPPAPSVHARAYAAWIMRKKVDREQVYVREATIQFFASLGLGH
ncbi:hypothetical protein R3P38DRAFT_3287893 [Favolaschia claudopus]|uniref:MYND-type domain-containing protein n=1 Tax=Favolaschia claudopus TaxID=2862362 RepID=A0AAV9ZXS6_9AGAR